MILTSGEQSTTVSTSLDLKVGGHRRQTDVFVLVAVLVHEQIFLFCAAGRAAASTAIAAAALNSRWHILRLSFAVALCRTLGRAVDELLDEGMQSAVVLDPRHFEGVVVGAARDRKVFPVDAAHRQIVQGAHVDRRHQLVRVAYV